MKAYIKGYNRCRWMAIVSAVFTVMTVGFIIPGAIGVSGLNHYNDTLLYLAIIDLIFALLFLFGWILCQFEVDEATLLKQRDFPITKNRKPSITGSVCSAHSVQSFSSHQMLTLGGGNVSQTSYGSISQPLFPSFKIEKNA